MATANTYLAKINAPVLGNGFTESFMNMVSTINDNFSKIASAPYLRGDDGASFTAHVSHVWEEANSNDWRVTDDGALLLSAIFGVTITSGMSYSGVCNALSDFMITVSTGSPAVHYPIESFFTDGVATNNNIYFYQTINDAGEVTSKCLAQYFMFIDARMKYIEDATVNDRAQYQDTSCFVTYIPENGNEAAHFERTSVMPTIYYDSAADCMCWKYNGIETGIPATGTPGADGTNSQLLITKCNALQSAQNGAMAGWMSIGNNVGEWITSVDALVEEPYNMKVYDDGAITYPVIVCLYDSNDFKNSLLGVMKIHHVSGGTGLTATCYWTEDSGIAGPVDKLAIKEYFDTIGVNADPSYLRGLKVPSKADSDVIEDKRSTSHLIYASDESSAYSDLHIAQVTGDGNSLSAVTPVESVKELVIDNYNLTVNYDINASNVNIANSLTANSVYADNGFINSINATTINANSISAASAITAKVNSLSDVYVGCPVGTIVMWCGWVPLTAITPSSATAYKVAEDWLLCNGALITGTSDYSRLVSVIGTKVPDLLGRFPIGMVYNSSDANRINANVINSTTPGGAYACMMTKDMVAEHIHPVVIERVREVYGAEVVADRFQFVTTPAVATGTTPSKNITNIDIRGLATENIYNGDNQQPIPIIPPYLGVHFIIKYR